jgi:hypothetical protein
MQAALRGRLAVNCSIAIPLFGDDCGCTAGNEQSEATPVCVTDTKRFRMIWQHRAQALHGNIEELMTAEHGLDANPEELIYRPLLLNCRGELRLQLGRLELA